MVVSNVKGMIFDIQRFSLNDGPGIRTTVFFKGCPLRCSWCSNPESQDPNPELFYFDNLCSRCYRCVEVCPNNVIAVKPDGSLTINYELCKACGTCVDVCPSEARFISGKRMTITEVLETLKKDSIFYQNSSGGITASGGEPTAQPEFLTELFRRCQDIGFHTTLDTCGYISWEVMEKILEYVDLVLYDIKHMNPTRHRELVGVDNKIILTNAEYIARMGKPMIVRLPLIPTVNDSVKNVKAIAQFMRHIGIRYIDIVPYHRLGINKYKQLGKDYKPISIKTPKVEKIEGIRNIIESYDLEVSIA